MATDDTAPTYWLHDRALVDAFEQIRGLVSFRDFRTRLDRLLGATPTSQSHMRYEGDDAREIGALLRLGLLIFSGPECGEVINTIDLVYSPHIFGLGQSPTELTIADFPSFARHVVSLLNPDACRTVQFSTFLEDLRHGHFSLLAQHIADLLPPRPDGQTGQRLDMTDAVSTASFTPEAAMSSTEQIDADPEMAIRYQAFTNYYTAMQDRDEFAKPDEAAFAASMPHLLADFQKNPQAVRHMRGHPPDELINALFDKYADHLPGRKLTRSAIQPLLLLPLLLILIAELPASGDEDNQLAELIKQLAEADQPLGTEKRQRGAGTVGRILGARQHGTLSVSAPAAVLVSQRAATLRSQASSDFVLDIRSKSIRAIRRKSRDQHRYPTA